MMSSHGPGRTLCRCSISHGGGACVPVTGLTAPAQSPVYARDDHGRLSVSYGPDQFLNNHVTLRSRTAYEDYPEPERRRDLIRLWLNVNHPD